MGVQVKRGEVVIREGEDGDNFYVIDWGRYVVTKGGETMITYEGKGAWNGVLLRDASSCHVMSTALECRDIFSPRPLRTAA